MLHEPWRIQLLGGLRLHQPSLTIERFRTRKAAGLLAYLAFYADRQHSREELAELFWPELDYAPQAKSHNLSQTLSTLRRFLEPTPNDKGSVLRATHAHIAFNREAIIVDAAEFEAALGLAAQSAEELEQGRHLSHALALYTGDLLPGSYEDWALRERDRLSGLFVQTLLQLAEQAGRQNQTEQALEHALRAAYVAPYNEAVHHAVLRGLVASGQTQRAIVHFREFEARLKVELHAEPSDLLRALIPGWKGEQTFSSPRLASASPPQASPAVLSSTPSAIPPALPAPDAAVLSAAVAPIVHLPLTLTKFFGRESEQEQAGLLLESARLLTLIGPGGCGKTRLAIEIGRHQATHFDTVVFVALADVAEPLDFMPAVAEAIVSALRKDKAAPAPGLASDQEALQQIEMLLATRRTLLILDNFEHIPEAKRFLPDLLAACPQLSCLITSRRPLHLSGERLLTIAPFPSPDATLPPTALQSHPSIRLFLDRAQAMRSDFRLTAHNAPLLAGLCADLDGLPLALELAAARIGTFTLTQMRKQLKDGGERFQLLVSRHRDTHHRHHSLNAALGWSFCQLSPAQQRCFARLSRLHGDWTAEAAHAIGGLADKQSTRDALEQLCLASLIVSGAGEEASDAPAEATFHLLETMRQFGQQQLTPEELAETAQQHAQFYLDLAETHSAGSDPETESIWLALMQRSAPNLRAALDWCFGTEGDSATGLRLCIAMIRFWYFRCHFAEGLRYFTLALVSDSDRQDRSLRADALHGAALYASRLNHYEDAAAWGRECLQLRREGNNTEKTARCMQNLAHYVWCLHDMAAAEAYHFEALALYETLQNSEGIGRAYGGLGSIAECRGDVERAEQWQTQYLGLAQQSGNQAEVARALGGLSSLANCQEQWTRAKQFAEEAFAIYQMRQDDYQIAYAHIWLARACLGLSEWQEAETHLQTAVITLERLGDRSGLAGTHRAWAELYWKQGKADEAYVHLQQCFTLLLQIKEPLSIGKIAEQWLVRTFDPTDASRLLPLLAALDIQQTVEPYRRLPLEQRDWNACVAKAKSIMGADAFHRAWDQGRNMAWNEALGLILALRCFFVFVIFNFFDCSM